MTKEKDDLIRELTDEPDILSEVFLQQKADFKESEDTILRNILHSEEYKNLVDGNIRQNKSSTVFKSPFTILKKLLFAVIIMVTCFLGYVLFIGGKKLLFKAPRLAVNSAEIITVYEKRDNFIKVYVSARHSHVGPIKSL